MKLVVIIPALNEEKSIAKVIKKIPIKISRISKIEVVVIDDGSTDNTSAEAKKAGATQIIKHKQNLGLAQAFKDGMDAALELEADIIVNIDGDDQHDAKEIPDLVKPIIEGDAEVVLGVRDISNIESMPLQKKIGNTIATSVTNFITGLKLKDAQCGFRAFSREAAMRINLQSDYTPVQETILQAVHKKLKIVQVPISIKGRETGGSRLISSLLSYAQRAGMSILRTYLYYKPLQVFLVIGGAIGLVGFAFGVRVLINFLQTGMVSPLMPSTILSSLLLIVGFQFIALGLIADLLHSNRKLQEETLYRIKKKK